ncbi:MAG: hypothetical protein ACLUIQ_11140 [Dialister invisus]
MWQLRRDKSTDQAGERGESRYRAGFYRTIRVIAGIVYLITAFMTARAAAGTDVPVIADGVSVLRRYSQSHCAGASWSA